MKAANFMKWTSIRILANVVRSRQIVSLSFWFHHVKRSWTRGQHMQKQATVHCPRPVHVVLFNELADITENWDCSRIIGRGGFGPVFKALWRDQPVILDISTVYVEAVRSRIWWCKLH